MVVEVDALMIVVATMLTGWRHLAVSIKGEMAATPNLILF